MAGSTVRFESRTRIRRPIDEVFDLLADLPGYPRWMHRNGMFRGCGLISAGPVRNGTRYFDATRMGRFQGEVTEFVPPSRIAFCETLHWFGAQVTQARPAFFLEAEDEATVVHHVAVGELFGPFRLMKPAAAQLAKMERTRTLDSLRRALEST